jgi:hypothetical protein
VPSLNVVTTNRPSGRRVSAHISHAPTPIHNRQQDVVGAPFKKLARHRSRKLSLSHPEGLLVTDGRSSASNNSSRIVAYGPWPKIGERASPRRFEVARDRRHAHGLSVGTRADNSERHMPGSYGFAPCATASGGMAAPAAPVRCLQTQARSSIGGTCGKSPGPRWGSRRWSWCC